MARKALCVGINTYPLPNADLRGCVKDAHAWASLLTGQYDFATSDVRIEVVEPPLNLRDAPGLAGAVRDRLRMGAKLTVAGGPQRAAGHAWYEVTRESAIGGWVAGRFCRRIDW